MKHCKCKVTGEKIPIILNYGDMPIANDFSKKINKKNNYKMQIAFNENNGKQIVCPVTFFTKFGQKTRPVSACLVHTVSIILMLCSFLLI